MDTPVIVTDCLRDQGTIVVFSGVDEDGCNVVFAVDHRPAQDILDALEHGYEPVALVPDWAFLGSRGQQQQQPTDESFSDPDCICPGDAFDPFCPVHQEARQDREDDNDARP